VKRALPEEKAAMCFSGIKSTLEGQKHELIYFTRLSYLHSTGSGMEN
jgi:hypothetical protein